MKWWENREQLLAALKSEDRRITTLNDAELDAIAEVLSEMEQTGSSSIFEELVLADFWRKPPTIQEFMFDPYFLGGVCQPDSDSGQIGLIKELQDDLIEAFRDDRDIACSQLIYSGSIGNGKCTKAGTRIPTTRGLLKIEDSRIGDTVKSEDGWRLIENWFDEGTMDCIEATTSCGLEITGSHDRHRIRILNGLKLEWRLLRDIKPGDITIIDSGDTSTIGVTFDPYYELLGLQTADGVRKVTPHTAFALATHIDEASFLNGHYSLHGPTLQKPYSRNLSGRNITFPFIDNGTREQSLLYCWEKPVPNSVWSASRNQQLSWLRGWFSGGGGNITDKGLAEVCTSSKQLAYDAQQLLLFHGIRASVNQGPSKNSASGRGGRTRYRLRIWSESTKTFTEKVGFIYPWKQEQLEKSTHSDRFSRHTIAVYPTSTERRELGIAQPASTIASRGGQHKRHGPRGIISSRRNQGFTIAVFRKLKQAGGILPWHLNKIGSGEWTLAKVDTIRRLNCRCYDITVDGNPSYISNGFISHNTYAGIIALLFRMSKALCMRNPLLYYKLSEATSLNYFILSITREQVGTGAFGDAINMLRMSPFFREVCEEDLTKKEFKSQAIRFHHNILLQAGSQARHAIGKNTLGAFIDEINFRIQKDSQASAKDMHDAIVRRTKSRFGDSDDGLLVMVSSSKNETDFLVSHIRNNRTNRAIKCVARSFWDGMGKYKYAYTGEKFWVDPGDPFNLPRILDENEDIEKLVPEVQARIIHVPVEHFLEFSGDLIGSIRDIAGISAINQRKFFYNHLHLINTIRDDVEDVLEGLNEIQMSIDSDHHVQDFMNLDLLLSQAGSGFRPRRNPMSPRFIHFDMSTGAQDALGVACVHPVWSTEVDFIDPMTQIIERRIMPVYETDFVFGVRRGSSGEPIDFGKLRKFLFWMRTNGFPIKAVTADLLAMSIEMINILKQNGIDASYLSVDRNKVPYSILRQATAEGRIAIPYRPLLFEELVNLEDGDRKIDHPERNSVVFGKHQVRELASKDEGDALAGAITKAESMKEAFNLTLQRIGDAAFAYEARIEKKIPRLSVRTF